MRLKQFPMRLKTISNEIINYLSVELTHFPYESNNLNFYETFALTEDSKTLTLTTFKQRLRFPCKYER